MVAASVFMAILRLFNGYLNKMPIKRYIFCKYRATCFKDCILISVNSINVNV
jgi:hypothetical protein